MAPFDVTGIASLVGALFAVVFGLAFLVMLGWLWLTRESRLESELGPVIFSDEVRVKFRRRPSDPFSFVTRTMGWPRLRVHEDTIAIRCPGVPLWLASVMMMNYTLEAADCEMDVRSIRRWHPLAGPLDKYVVLRTRDRRGWLELGFKPRTATLESLEQELVRAGAQPARRPIPAGHQSRRGESA